MSPALKAIRDARLAGVMLAPHGDVLKVSTAPKPTEKAVEVLRALREHKPAVLRLLAAERCKHCAGPGTPQHPLFEAHCYGHFLLIHRKCIDPFLEGDQSAACQAAPKPACDYCGRADGKLERITYVGAPDGGVLVHLNCAATWFERLDALPLERH